MFSVPLQRLAEDLLEPKDSELPRRRGMHETTDYADFTDVEREMPNGHKKHKTQKNSRDG
jgi:hypothetical protein